MLSLIKKRDESLQKCTAQRTLTGNSSRILKSLRDFWVDSNVEVAFRGHFLVSLVDLIAYPLLELTAHNSVDHAADVRLSELNGLYIFVGKS